MNNQLRQGDWTCSQCNNIVFAKKTSCPVCNKTKTTETRKGSDVFQLEDSKLTQLDVTIKAGDWICTQCSAHNFSRNVNCRQCDQSWISSSTSVIGNNNIVQQQDYSNNSSNSNASDWVCFCGQLNYASNANICTKCGVIVDSSNHQGGGSTPSLNVVPKSGDWNCSCGELNFASRDMCRKCGQSKVNIVTSSSNNIVPKSGDWNCSCGELNFASRVNCRKCNLAKNTTISSFHSSNVQTTNSGDWNCSCGELNFASRVNCRKCGNDKNIGSTATFTISVSLNTPTVKINSGLVRNTTLQTNTIPTSSINVLPNGDWNCSCGELNFASRVNCRKCNLAKNTISSSHSSNVQTTNSGDWNCSCGELNFASRVNCRKCNLARNTTSNISSSHSSNVQTTNSGDWNCSCGELNFASRKKCRKCNLDKNTTSSSNSSSTHQRRSDWNCSCGELNFASRKNCRKCGKSA